MSSWWVEKVLPGIVAGSVLALLSYAWLWFEKRWPYWGRRRSGS